jgi:hypothetical protein
MCIGAANRLRAVALLSQHLPVAAALVRAYRPYRFYRPYAFYRRYYYRPYYYRPYAFYYRPYYRPYYRHYALRRR